MRNLKLWICCAAVGLFHLPASAQTSITTYHYNNYRTGWNNTETVLTPSNVYSPNLIATATVSLDDQVDAQPLVVPNVSITAGNYQGTHTVVYVATENNSVYAIDATSGTILLSTNLGAPVPNPLGCHNNGPNVGITSTPVIDTASNTIFVMAYVNNGPTYYLHALDLGSLAEKSDGTSGKGLVVAASHSLSPSGTFIFNATYQRQRPALLWANGNVYAGFGSFCDFDPASTRGWLLGWKWAWNGANKTGTITELAANQLTDYQETDSGSYFLSSIWMSGYGPSTDDSGNILFVTGNSDPNVDSYDGVTNVQESVVKVSPTLSRLGVFTPSSHFSWDQGDQDFGSGGVMVLPDQTGSVPHMAVAAGKDSGLYFLNEDSLANLISGNYTIGACWCGESYYVDPSDGLARVVASGGSTLGLWKLATSPSPSLTKVSSASISSGQDGGFFTSVSSNGTSNPIIWALSRPTSTDPPNVNLLAFNPDASLGELINIPAGTWPNQGGNANLVPVVANGHVYVASYKQLQIFGLSTKVTRTATVGSNNSSCGNPVIGDVVWNDPSGVASAGAGANAVLDLSVKGEGRSDCLNATAFNFAIPSTAKITDIQATFNAYVSGGSGSPSGMLQLETLLGTGGGQANVFNQTDKSFTVDIGDAGLSPTVVNGSGFGVSFQASPVSPDINQTTFYVGDVQLSVYYH